MFDLLLDRPREVEFLSRCMRGKFSGTGGKHMTQGPIKEISGSLRKGWDIDVQSVGTPLAL